MDHSTQSTEFMAKWFFENFNFFFKRISYSIFLLCNIIPHCRHFQQPWLMISTNSNLRYQKMPPNNLLILCPNRFWEKQSFKRFFFTYLVIRLCNITPPPWRPQPTTRVQGSRLRQFHSLPDNWFLKKKIAKRCFSIYSCFVPSFGAITNSSSKG